MTAARDMDSWTVATTPSQAPARAPSQPPSIEITEHRCFAGPEHRPFEEEHGASNVALVLTGAFRYRAGGHGAAVSLGPGSIMLGNPGQPYVCSHELGHGDHCLCFRLGPGVLDAIAAQLALPGAPRFVDLAIPPAPALAGAWSRAVAAARGAVHAPSTEEAGYELAAAVLTAAADRKPPARPVTALDERRAADAMRWLDAHAAEPLGLDDAAAALGVGAFHFLRTFRRVVGVTPHQYLVGARLRRAADLLLASDQPVTDIAFDAGFGDLSNFIRTFRRATGASPRAFRAASHPRVTPRTGGAQVKIRQVAAAAPR